MTHDFVFLNVHNLTNCYENPSPTWKEKVRALAETQIRFFKDEGLFKPSAPAIDAPVEEAVLMFSDFTEEGQKFIMTAATDKWLQSCDTKGDLEAYKDPSGLVKRLRKFRENQERKAR